MQVYLERTEKCLERLQDVLKLLANTPGCTEDPDLVKIAEQILMVHDTVRDFHHHLRNSDDAIPQTLAMQNQSIQTMMMLEQQVQFMIRMAVRDMEERYKLFSDWTQSHMAVAHGDAAEKPSVEDAKCSLGKLIQTIKVETGALIVAGVLAAVTAVGYFTYEVVRETFLTVLQAKITEALDKKIDDHTHPEK